MAADRDRTVRRTEHAPSKAGGIVATLLLLVIGFGVFGIGTILALLSLTVIDTCPPATCNAGRAIAAVSIGIGAAFLAWLASAILAVLRLVRRRNAWWVAVIGIVAVVVLLTAGVVVELLAIGYL